MKAVDRPAAGVSTARRSRLTTAVAGAWLCAACLVVLLPRHPLAADTIELRSVSGVPAHLVGLLEEPLATSVLDDGRILVFDRRAHAVFLIDASRTTATRIVQVGQEEGRVLQPTAFDAAPDGTFVVADAPRRRERIQFFDASGRRLGGFELPGTPVPRVTLGNLVLSGVGSVQFTGRSILVNQPETGALVTEYARSGYPQRSFGHLRATGHEHDRALHLALNAGLPLVAQDGGTYFVFQTGAPRFRRYDASGALVFERVIQGRDVDAIVAALPTVWPRRRLDDQELPLVTPTVRTAAVDRDGGLWVAFVTGVTHRFDADGDRVAAYRLRGAGALQPTSFFFTPTRALVTPGLFEFDVPVN